ncbi:MAG: hypothetical protein QNJ34_15760 [Xenococcaceae cyanobacterium MO_188.B29]|nr:hypothetical protein [Xenococcaceae cyanobacterium MO_188.B29]
MNQKEDFQTLNQTAFFQPNYFKYSSKRLIGLAMVAISIYLGSIITRAKQSEEIKQISSPQSVKKLSINRAYLEQMDVRGTVTGGEGNGQLLRGVNPQQRSVGIREVKSPQEPHKIGLTWLIIHGYNSNPDEIDIANLIDSISTNVPPNDRVLVLDWREVAVNGSVFNFGNFRAATWITPVAEYVVRELNQTYQIDSNLVKKTQSLLQKINCLLTN